MANKKKGSYDKGYEKSVNGTIKVLNSAASKGDNHIAFKPEYRAVYVSPPDSLRSISSGLDAAAVQGNTEEVNTLWAKGIQALDFNAQHINMLSVYLNDPSILDAGYPMMQAGVGKTKVSLLDLVPKLDAKYLYANKDIVTETVVLLIGRERSNAVVELVVSENPNDETSWRRVGEGTYNQSRVELRGLESAKRLYFRVRYHEKGAVGHWSPIVSILIH